MPGLMCATARSADSNDSTVKPASCSACTLPMRTAVSSSIRKTLIPSSMVSLHGRRELDREFGATLSPVRGDERAAEFADDARRNRQPEAKPRARLLGRDERLEDSRQKLGCDARPGVAYRDGYLARVLAHRHLDATHRALLHRIKCIDDEIHEHPFH